MRTFRGLSVVLGAAFLWLASVGVFAAQAAQLTVALYPYVPRVAQFRAAIQSEWKKIQPAVSLNFVDDLNRWDGGYKTDPPDDVDVYVFDAMFFEYFKSMNWLEPMDLSEVLNVNDFVGYALDGVKAEGKFFSIPQLGCTNVLFYQKTDTALANATTLSSIRRTLSQCTYTSKIPPDRRGLMIDLPGGTAT